MTLLWYKTDFIFSSYIHLSKLSCWNLLTHNPPTSLTHTHTHSPSIVTVWHSHQFSARISPCFQVPVPVWVWVLDSAWTSMRAAHISHLLTPATPSHSCHGSCSLTLLRPPPRHCDHTHTETCIGGGVASAGDGALMTPEERLFMMSWRVLRVSHVFPSIDAEVWLIFLLRSYSFCLAHSINLTTNTTHHKYTKTFRVPLCKLHTCNVRKQGRGHGGGAAVAGVGVSGRDIGIVRINRQQPPAQAVQVNDSATAIKTPAYVTKGRRKKTQNTWSKPQRASKQCTSGKNMASKTPNLFCNLRS